MKQEKLPTPQLPARPTLPDAFAGAPHAQHRQHKVQRRDLCSVCVWLLYHEGGAWAPLHAKWMRTDPDWSCDQWESLHRVSLLCQQHHMEWLERDQFAKKCWKEAQA